MSKKYIKSIKITRHMPYDWSRTLYKPCVGHVGDLSMGWSVDALKIKYAKKHLSSVMPPYEINQ